MKSFKEFLNERVSQTKPTEKRKVTKEELRDMILKGEDISEVDYSDITDMGAMFMYTSITDDLLRRSNLDTHNVTEMGSMFFDCKKLQHMPHMEMQNVTDINNMFANCVNLKEVSYMETDNVTDMSFTFYGCSSLEHIPAMNTSKVTDMSSIFGLCDKINSIERPSDWYKYDWNSVNAPKHLKDKYPELYDEELR